MIHLRDVLVRPEILDSERVCALTPTCQLFFRNLLHACDGAGRFLADAEELRDALYRRAPGVTSPHVEAWLRKCHQARLVKLYTRGVKGYGEILNYGQRDGKRRVLHPGPDEEPDLFSTDPPGGIGNEVNRREGKGRKRREAPETPAPAESCAQFPRPTIAETQEAWIGRLRETWAGVDITIEILNAERNRRQAGKQLERRWFETEWLPKCSVPVTVALAEKKSFTALPEPADWRVYLKDRYYGQSWADSAGACEWANVPRHWQERITREMKGAA